MRENKPHLISAILLTAVLFLSACSPENKPTQLPTPTPEAEQATQQPTAIKLTPAAAAPKETTAPAPENSPIPSVPEDILFSIGDPYAAELGSRAIDVQHYDLHIALEPGVSNSILAQAEITLQALYTPLDIFALDFAGFEILDVSIDGIGVDFSRRNEKLIIEPLLPYLEGETFTVSISYSGRPLQEQSRFVPFTSYLGIIFASAQNIFVLSEPDGAHYWFPCSDHSNDKATFAISIQVPEGFTAVSNGQLVSEETLKDGTSIFHWEHSFPMAPYLATFAVGKYETHTIKSPSGFEIVSYVYGEDTYGFETEMKDIAEAFDWFSELLIPYPYESFGYAIVEGFGSSLETQTMVILDENMVSEFVMIHELVHMWIGDLVSLDSWSEMWRNEGITNYYSMMWLFRDDPEGLMNYMEIFEADALTWENTEPLADLSPGNLFGTEAYEFGMLVTHKLRQEVGDEAFFEGMRVYLLKYAYSTASDEDFQAVMEEVSGLELDDFFEHWLNYASTSDLK